MISIRRFLYLLNRLMSITTPQEVSTLADDLARPPRQTEIVAFANAHAFNLSCRDETFYHALRDADTLLRDGSGVGFLLRLCRQPIGINMNGTDFLPRVIQQAIAQRCRIALIGAEASIVKQAAKQLTQQGAHLCFYADGFQPFSRYMSLLDTHQPELTFLAMGMPRQEIFASQVRALGQHPTRLFCGGAILDFYTSKVQRAPAWLRRLGMEWFYRLCREPTRLAKRYIIGNPIFVIRSFITALVNRKKYRA